MVALEALAAALLHQRRTVAAAVLRLLYDRALARHHAGAAGGVAVAPRAPVADAAVAHCKTENGTIRTRLPWESCWLMLLPLVWERFVYVYLRTQLYQTPDFTRPT